MSDPAISPIDDHDAELRAEDDRETVGQTDPDQDAEALETVTNDAVAGDTVYPQPGDGADDGPTGGAPREGEPDLWEHDDDEPKPDLGNDLGTKPL